MAVFNTLRKKLTVIAFVLAAVFSLNTFATIVVDVTDNAGQAEFTFSGLDTVSVAGSINNGFWFNDLFEATVFTGNPNYTGQHLIVSGTADLIINAISYHVNDVYVNGTNFDWELGFRAFTNPYTVSVGDTIGLAGSIVTDLNFSWFNPGFYHFTSVGPYQASEAKLTNGIMFNVRTVTVPEPGSLAIIVLGLVAFGFSRKIKNA